jgi:hypothetical protein
MAPATMQVHPRRHQGQIVYEDLCIRPARRRERRTGEAVGTDEARAGSAAGPIAFGSCRLGTPTAPISAFCLCTGGPACRTEPGGALKRLPPRYRRNCGWSATWVGRRRDDEGADGRGACRLRASYSRLLPVVPRRVRRDEVGYAEGRASNAVRYRDGRRHTPASTDAGGT